MISPLLLLLLFLIILLFAFKYSFVRPKGTPPGPPRITLFGSYLFLLMVNFKYLHKAALFFSKLYKSKIISLYIGEFYTVVVNDSTSVQKVLNSTDYDARPDVFLGRLRDPLLDRKGIFFNDGPVWKEQRRFILRHLRDFGFGRRFVDLEGVIHEEIKDMLDLIKNGPKFDHEHEICRKGHQMLCPFIFMPFTTNCFLHVMSNERFPRSEQESLMKVAKAGTVFQRVGDDYGKLLSAIPWIRHIFPNWSSYNTLNESNKVLYEFFKETVHRHVETYDDSSERNFIDLYIKEMKSNEHKGEENTFSIPQFILGLVDFAFPAITALGIQISLFIQWAQIRPDIIKRMQKEIEDVVGDARLPSLDDRKNLNYCEAAIREILRLETLVPSDILHFSTVDTTLMGYHIPKGTVIVPSLYAFHNDKEVWTDPEEFRPDRFLDSDGKLSLKLDISLPFGAGKRLCAGETFARNMLFLMITAICQQFNFILLPGEKMQDPSKNLSGIVISPPDFWQTLEVI